MKEKNFEIRGDFEIRGRAGLECIGMFAKNFHFSSSITYTVESFGVERKIMPKIGLFWSIGCSTERRRT
jgi:hypothetical protein